VIPIAHDKHRDIQNSTLKVAETLGSKGIGSDDPAYINRMNTIISDFKRGMSSQDALSLGADFLKTGGQLGEYAGIIKKIAEKPELVETMTFNDRDEFGKVIGTIKGMEGYKEFIADQYALIAKTTNDSLKEEYNKKLRTQKPSTPPKPTESEIQRVLTSSAAQKYSLDISKFKNELGIKVNDAGIAIGDAKDASLDIESDNFPNLVNKLGFRISSRFTENEEDPNYNIQSIELKEQGGNKTFEVVPGQNTISFLEQAFLMQGVNRIEVPKLINNVLYGTFIPPSQETNTDYED